MRNSSNENSLSDAELKAKRASNKSIRQRLVRAKKLEDIVGISDAQADEAYYDNAAYELYRREVLCTLSFLCSVVGIFYMIIDMFIVIFDQENAYVSYAPVIKLVVAIFMCCWNFFDKKRGDDSVCKRIVCACGGYAILTELGLVELKNPIIQNSETLRIVAILIVIEYITLFSKEFDKRLQIRVTIFRIKSYLHYDKIVCPLLYPL